MPQMLEAYSLKGSLDLRAGRYADALADYGYMLKLQPNDANAHVNVGQIYADMNRLDLAAEHINKALQINPEHPGAYFIRGVVCLRMGQRAAACDALNKANELGYPAAEEWLRNNCR
jgi:tetratricopeptide (TPR) repeat protein